jgi:hypothetical protein
MQVLLDGKEIDGANPEERLDGLRQTLRRNRRVPQRLLLDGMEQGLEQLAELEAGKGLRVELETVGLGEAAVRGYAEAAAFLPKVAQVLERCSDRLSLGQVTESMNDFSRVCQGVSWFFDMVGSLDKLLGAEMSGGWERDAAELKTLLVQTEESIGQQDWVMVADQMRYEWAPRLHAWCGRLSQAQAEATAVLLAKS